MATDVPPSLLIRFFQEAKTALDNYESDDCLCSLSAHRKALLQVQVKCLARVVDEHNKGNNNNDISIDNVQVILKNLSTQENVNQDVKQAMNAMNQAARLAYCRLVLHDECQWNVSKTPPRKLNNGHTSMSRQDLVEYAGLCNSVVRLPNVERHLLDGTPLFDDIQPQSPAPIFCKKRLDRIQQLLLRAVGFEIEFGKMEIERYFQMNPSEMDAALVNLLEQLSSNMTVALANAQQEIPTLSDEDKGGVTRVVSVSYSEKVVAPDGKEIATAASAPSHESIREHDEQEQFSQLQVAKQAARLQTSILNDLVALSNDERSAKLELARETHDDFMKQAMELPAGPERISFLTSVDAEKQQLLLIHKLWNAKELEENNGG